jgi:MFS family permease
MSTELPLRTDPAVPPGPPVARRGVFLALMCSVQFVLVVGGTVVTVSLPAIRHELHLAPAQLQWVLTGFALTRLGQPAEAR